MISAEVFAQSTPPGTAPVPPAHDAIDPRLLPYRRYSASLSPAIVASHTCAAQSFTFAGIRAADILVGVNKPTEQAGLSVTPGHVIGANTLTLNFCNYTGAGITPTAAETYNVVVRNGSRGSRTGILADSLARAPELLQVMSTGSLSKTCSFWRLKTGSIGR